MLDRENLLKVAEVVLANEQANERVAAAQVRLETARAVVETIRTEITEAKEGVAAAKAALDSAVAAVEYTGMSKTAIVKAAEEINRVFLSHGIGVSTPASDEVEAEPEVSRLTLKKIGERVAEKIAGFTDGDENLSFDREAVLALLADIQQTVSDGAPGSKASKDSDPAPAKRKRRGKADPAAEAAEPTVEALAATEVPVAGVVASDHTESNDALSSHTVNAFVTETDAQTVDVSAAEVVRVSEETEEPAADQTATAMEELAELDAPIVELEDDKKAEYAAGLVLATEEIGEPGVIVVDTVAEIADTSEVLTPDAADIDDFVEPAIEEVAAVDNSHVREEVMDLIDGNVTEDDLSGIITSVAYAAYVKAEVEQAALTVYSYLDLMTLDTVTAVATAPYGERLAGELEALASDPAYTTAVLSWFRNGISMIEAGKDFPAFAGIGSSDNATAPDAPVPPAEETSAVAEAQTVDVPAADEVFTADQDLPEDAEAAASIGEVDAVPVEEPAQDTAIVDAPVPVAEATPVPEAPAAVAKPEPVKAPPPFMKPGFMKPTFMK